MVITLILFSVANIILAWIDSRIIADKQKILHGLNGVVYLALLLIPYFMYHNWFLIAALCFNRLLWFNISLSKFRSLDWDYVSPSPKSIIDKVAKAIFGSNGKLMYFIYLVLFTICTVLIFII